MKFNKKIDEVNVLKDKLDEYKTAFNFVGLSQGFENLLKQKKRSQKENFSLVSQFSNSRTSAFRI